MKYIYSLLVDPFQLLDELHMILITIISSQLN